MLCSMSLSIINTSDGSHTLYNKKLNETYHSIHGAIQESEHIYIESGIKHFTNTQKKKNIQILEVGFGTGLNFLLTYKFSLSHTYTIHYNTIESNPLKMEIVNKLNYIDMLGEKYRDVFTLMHSQKSDEEIGVSSKLFFNKQILRLEEFQSKKKYDIIFFDAFAPSKQPDIWSAKNLQKVYNAMEKDAILVTYCSSGKFKKTLKELGYKVEVISGPPGKKEMVRASKK